MRRRAARCRCLVSPSHVVSAVAVADDGDNSVDVAAVAALFPLA